MKKTITITNKVLELEQLEALLLRICNTINVPIRKNQLIRFIKDLFGYSNTVKQIQFALISLIEQKKLIQNSYFICTSELAEEGITIPTATEEWIIKFLLSEALKEDIKHDIFFDVNSNEKITPSIYFKYVVVRQIKRGCFRQIKTVRQEASGKHPVTLPSVYSAHWKKQQTTHAD